MKIEDYNPALDGLRALAVLSVIGNHFYEKFIPSGYLGVDIFFVLSGFVITNSLLKRKETSVKYFFAGFYKRRIKRLIPALLLCFCTASILISFFTISPSQHITTGLFSIPGLSNIFLYFDNTDYWGGTAKLNPFTHTWSLGVEEQFYLIFPFIIWVTVRENRHTKDLKRLQFILLIACTLSIFSFVYFSILNSDLTYFLMPFRFWEIGMGCILYLQLKIRVSQSILFIDKTPLSLLLFLIIVILFLPKEYNIPATIAVVFFTLLLILKVRSKETALHNSANNLLTNKIVLYIGKISYSLYLWHWVIIVVSRWTIGVDVFLLPFQLILILLISAFSYHFVEKPLRHSSWRDSLRPKLILIPLVIVVGLFFFSLKLFPNTNHLYLGNKDQLISKPQNDLLILSGYENTKHCSKIRVLGNSHSLSILPMLNIITKQCGIKLIHETHPNYILIPNGDGSSIDKLNGVMSSLNKGDILILCSRYRYLYKQPYLDGKGEKWVDHSKEKEEKKFGLKIWLQELDTIITKSRRRGINVILFLPNVEFDKEVPNIELCKKEWFRIPSQDNNITVSREYLNRRFPQEFYDQVKFRSDKKTNFYVFDPLPIYCPSGNCSRIINGVAAFSDTNHLSPEGAKLMLEAFASFLIQNKLL